MGRPEKPVDRTVPARAKLADFLRDRKAAANLTYREMSEITDGAPSKATLERAASGASVPLWETVRAFVLVTMVEEEEPESIFAAPPAMARGKELWIRARRATRAPYYIHKAPDPALISSKADLSRALRHQHVWAGYPTPGEMERMSGPGELPSSTTRRIIEGTTLPVDPIQILAFLNACYVLTPAGLEPWLAATVRVFEKKNTTGYPGKWSSAHVDLLEQIQRLELFEKIGDYAFA